VCESFLAVGGLNARGDSYALGLFVAGFVFALILSLVPMRRGIRVGLIAAGVVGIFIFWVARPLARPYKSGLDAVAWGFILFIGIVGWCLGFVPLALVRTWRRFANPS